ncbi:hypothetical protein B0H63DRAFT_458211 [Podospora didyma]|uniref:Secreted protein n=1 Tax=Podospora didyma TaxID=330526 RepID=A0AAE0P502_9PEZI|nr:hypothetical protein B0H63DRAFT_458211 [Podospora didyma]
MFGCRGARFLRLAHLGCDPFRVFLLFLVVSRTPAAMESGNKATSIQKACPMKKLAGFWGWISWNLVGRSESEMKEKMIPQVFPHFLSFLLSGIRASFPRPRPEGEPTTSKDNCEVD